MKTAKITITLNHDGDLDLDAFKDFIRETIGTDDHVITYTVK